MSVDSVLISHATADDDFVRDLRLAWRAWGTLSRNLWGGDVLDEEIENASRGASSSSPCSARRQ
jgi:hypothetical protein